MQYIFNYLKKHNISSRFVSAWHASVPLIIVIPCYNEPNIKATLESLKACTPINANVEIIVVINSAEHETPEIIQQNRATYNFILNHYAFSEEKTLNVYPLLIENIKSKHAGAGYARKVGMDMAVSTFNVIANSKGLIVSLDADTIVAENYLEVLFTTYKNSSIGGGTMAYQHQTDSNNSKAQHGALLYELHLRYYHNALRFSGFPYTFYTIGSAFFVRCSEYVKHGGMNRRQGGEDFYFLHKVLPKTNYVTLNNTCVYPSSRMSARVPFGTGPQIIQFVEKGLMNTYSLEAFMDLKTFFGFVEQFYSLSNNEIEPLIYDLNKPLNNFLQEFSVLDKIMDVKQNTNQIDSFKKRFFNVFNAFFVVKYLNYSHQTFYNKNNVICEARKFLALQHNVDLKSSLELLEFYKQMDLNTSYY